ncbi:unnamed protein product [Cochlearia groenlandica]
MRSATFFLVSCILMCLLFNNIKDVEGEQCGRKDIFIGGCGSDGNQTCINDFVKKGGPTNKPSSCECDNFGEEHLCRCNFPC